MIEKFKEQKLSSPFRPARLVMSSVRRISIAFLEFADSSSSSSGQGISKVWERKLCHQPLQLKNRSVTLGLLIVVLYVFMSVILWQFMVQAFWKGTKNKKTTHLRWEYSGRQAEASRRWKAAHPWGTRTDTHLAPTSPPWSLDVRKTTVSCRLNATLSPVIPVRMCTKCTAVAEAGTELDWGWRDSASFIRTSVGFQRSALDS